MPTAGLLQPARTQSVRAVPQGNSRPECQPDVSYKVSSGDPHFDARACSGAPHFYARLTPEPPIFHLAVAHTYMYQNLG